MNLATIRYAMAGIIALLCGGAFADGVPLFTPGPTLAASDPVRQHDETKRPEFVKHYPIVLNSAVFGANVITVPVDGKVYRFIGSVMVPPTPAVHPPVAVAPTSSAPTPKPTVKQSPLQSWFGRTADKAGTLSIVKNKDTGALSGRMQLPPARLFTFFSGRSVMTETDVNRVPPIQWLSPAASAASGASK